MIDNKYVQLKLGNIISLIPGPAALYMLGLAMFMSFFSLLIHPTSQRYDTIGGINMIHPSALNMASACNDSKTTNYEKMSVLVSPQLIKQKLPN